MSLLPDANQPVELEAIYVADAMCSWCWGFAPDSRALADAIAGRASLRVVPGGLSIGTRHPLLPAEARQMVAHWRHVHEATGQPFDFEHPIDENTVYDTGPSCRAMAVVNRLRPASALDYLHRLQHAFYADREDLADAAVLARHAEACDVDRAAFERDFGGEVATEALDEELDMVHALGVQGFPAVALRSGPRVQLLTLGYRPWADLAPHVQNWLRQE